MLGAILIPIGLFAAGARINGTVVDAQTNIPLRDANITIAGTTIGTASDQFGAFTLSKIPPGRYVLKITFIGYDTIHRPILVGATESLQLRIEMKPTVLKGKAVTVTAEAEANRAIERETPVAFTHIELEQLKEQYTTGDLPELIQNAPGVWISSAGLGETEIKLRGFPEDKIRFMLNDIPMNEPEDNQVYWSNWSALANITQSISIYRGGGFSLFGTGAFGGSIHIETMGAAPLAGSNVRFSAGRFNRIGITSELRKGQLSQPDEGHGFAPAEAALNYTYSIRMNSGPLLKGKLNLSVFLEYKTGDSYILGTAYDGYSFGIEGESVLGAHKIRGTYFYAPQIHNQAFALQDIDLLETLGREYNRKNHEWQENFYRKPFLSLKHEWSISENTSWVNNVFSTFGKGADQTCMNDVFDVQTGKTDYQPVSQKADIVGFGEHALWLLDNFDLWTTDFDTAYNIPFAPYTPPHFKGFEFKDDTTNFFADQTTHSWQNRKRRDHFQVGISSYLQRRISNSLQVIIGAEGRHWRGHRESEAWYLRYSDLYLQEQLLWDSIGEINPLGKFQSIYNYDTRVNNFSGFTRITFKPFSRVTLQTGGQFAYTSMKVIENPIQFMDFGRFEFFDFFYRTSADQLDEYGNKKFADYDYERSYTYFTPWIGSSIILTQNFNLFANLTTAKKEPAILDWYDFNTGPLTQHGEGRSLVPESATSTEIGLGFYSTLIEAKIDYYQTNYKNKIESVVDINNRRETMNAGNALFKGIECEVKLNWWDFDFSGSANYSRNRWQTMAVSEIFGEPAEDVVGKVVPFSPERTLTASMGYHFTIQTNHHYRIGLSANYWNRYFGTYTNIYRKPDNSLAVAELPHFLDISARLSFTRSMKKVELTFRLDASNILNRKSNFMRAQYSIDYTRTDEVAGEYHWYVLQAPAFNIFVTSELAIR